MIGPQMMKVAFQITLFVLPWPVRRYILQKALGFHFDPGAKIGLSVLLCRELRMGANASIGHLTLVKGLDQLIMFNNARLGNLNWVTATSAGNPRHFVDQVMRTPRFVIGAHAAVTHRHLIDCTDCVELGDYTTFGGWGSQILTHSIDIRTSQQRAAPVKIGRYCFVGTRVIVLKGSVLPAFSVLSAGSVLAHAFKEEYTLYSGVPATKTATLERSAEYFSRTEGFIY